jgi:cell division protein FtsL
MISEEVAAMNIRNILSRVRFVYKPTALVPRLIILAVTAAVSLSAFLLLHSLTLKFRGEAEQWRAQAQQLEEANRLLEEKIEKLGTLEGIKDIAEEELGLVDPDTIIVIPGK